MNPICIAVTIWGREYIDAFLDFSLPSLLSKNNVPGLENLSSYQFLIRTSEEDIDYLKAAPAIRQLSENVMVDIKGFPSFLFIGGANADRYWRMSSLHREIISYCETLDAGIVFLPSDVIWADNTFSNMEKIINENAPRAIVMCTLRSQGENLKKYIERYLTTNTDSKRILTISSRDLVRMVLDNLHEETKSRCIDSQHFTDTPAHIYWPLGGQGFLARGAHLHPLYVHPRNYNVDFKSTFDADFLSKAVPDPADYYVCDDSDHLFFSDLTDPNEIGAVPDEVVKLNVSLISRWIAKHTGRPHRTFLNTPIWIHTGIDKSEWREQVEDSEMFNQVAQREIKRFSGES